MNIGEAKNRNSRSKNSIGVGVYLDYAATTPVSEGVLGAMKPYFSDVFGNAESVHSFGRNAQKAVDGAREDVAGALGADFREIIFTGSATEANNLALRGVIGTHGSGGAGWEWDIEW